MLKYFTPLLILMLTSPAQAASTAWQDIAPGAQLRLISSDLVDADGDMMVALEVRLAAGIKTYWRVPGETGIPLQLDFSGSRGVSDNEILWPIPLREQTGGFTDHVYYGDISFPIRLQLSDANPVLAVDVVMGVCSDICVPVSSHLDLTPAPGTRDAASDLGIRQALTNIPIDWPDDHPPIGTATYDPDANILVVDGVSDELDLDSLIASTESPAIIFAAPQKSPKHDVVTFARLGWGNQSDLTGETVSLIFQTPAGPYQVERVLVGIDQLHASD